MTTRNLKVVYGLPELIAHSRINKLKRILQQLRELKEVTMRPDEAPSLDHTYFAKESVLLTPPQTPVLDTSTRGCKVESLWGTSSQISDLDFDLEVFYTNYQTDEDTDDRFYDFAEDFRDLRKPMLKKDCMWGTGQWLGGASSGNNVQGKTSSLSTCSTELSSLVHRSTMTPLSFEFRPVSTTPTYLDEKFHSSFAPISDTPSGNDHEKCDVINSRTTTAAFPEVPLLPSPNDTESDDEIDVVNLTEKQDTSSKLSEAHSEDDTKEISESNPESPTYLSNEMKSLQRRMFQRQALNSRTNGRVSHNDLERKRRDELKRKFESLRQSIPDLETNDRAPKVMVLKKAREFIPYLQRQEKKLLLQKESLQNDKLRLMQKLVQLSNQKVYVQ